MNQYLIDDETFESQFRSVYLFGRNVATYKFALAMALLELSQQSKSFISLEDLAPYYVKHLLDHVKNGKRQSTSSSSKFLSACSLYSEGQITYAQLIDYTTNLGFNNVIDAFHNIPGGNLATSFYEKDVQGRSAGIVLTDSLFNLSESVDLSNMQLEIEGRWNLVESAWNDKNMDLAVIYDDVSEELIKIPKLTPVSFMNSHHRISLTPVRKPLNGYQKGKCFYCYSHISIDKNQQDTCDVDHFIPLSIQYNFKEDLDLNGVWNLVLACQDCNRGEINGKFSRLPDTLFLDRLTKRNDYLIESKHPLGETLILKTGSNSIKRLVFINDRFKIAQSLKTAEWRPRQVYGVGF